MSFSNPREEDVCPSCHQGELYWVYETVSGHPNDPNGTGWELLLCDFCERQYDKREVGL